MTLSVVSKCEVLQFSKKIVVEELKFFIMPSLGFKVIPA